MAERGVGAMRGPAAGTEEAAAMWVVFHMHVRSHFYTKLRALQDNYSRTNRTFAMDTP
mgnify:CR=1 FL=1